MNKKYCIPKDRWPPGFFSVKTKALFNHWYMKGVVKDIVRIYSAATANRLMAFRSPGIIMFLLAMIVLLITAIAGAAGSN